jgi:hypothetical protein
VNEIPYQVHPPSPAFREEWSLHAPEWLGIARGVVSEGSFDALTIKALYVTGVIFHLCLAVNILLDPQNLTPTVFYPAYAVFASAIELLGRCITGNTTDRRTNTDLITGFKWLARPSANQYPTVDESTVLITTANFSYTIKGLVALRHFAAHGQAILRPDVADFDLLVLGELPPVLGAAVQEYLTGLTRDATMATNLARASIAPFQSRPIFDALWQFMSLEDGFPEKVARAVRSMDWSYKSPLARLGRVIGAA